jgi:hypothetical protein
MTAIVGDGTKMERDYAFTSALHASDLESPASVGKLAGERTVARANPRKVPTCKVPVVYDPRVSNSLVGHVIGAANGASGLAAKTKCAGVVAKTRNVATGAASIAASAPTPTRYRTEGRRDKAINAAATAAQARHCHNECISAQPRACMTCGESQLSSLAIIVSLIRIQYAAEFFDFFC